MPIGITQENLPCAIRTHLGPLKVGFDIGQMLFPLVQVINTQGEVIATIVRVDHIRSLANDMKFLDGSQPEPRARKGERRTRDCFELKDLFIKPATCLDVANVDGDMVQFLYFHNLSPEIVPIIAKLGRFPRR